MDPLCRQYMLLEEKCIRVGELQAREKNEVLYYKGHHCSEILALRSSAEFEKSSKRGCDSMSFKRNGIKNLICCQHLSSDKFHSEQHFQADNAGVISTKPICFQSLEAICWPDTPALSQPSDSVNTKGQKRSSIVLQRLKHWLGVIMIHDTLSLWVIISEPSEWTLMVISDHRRDVVTACHPQVPTTHKRSGGRHRGVVSSITVTLHACLCLFFCWGQQNSWYWQAFSQP